MHKRIISSHSSLGLLRADGFGRFNVVRGVELLNDAAAGLLNQTGRRGLAGFVEVRLHRGRTLLDHDLIEHALGSNSGWSCKSNQGCSRIEQWRAHRTSIGLAILPVARAAGKHHLAAADDYLSSHPQPAEREDLRNQAPFPLIHARSSLWRSWPSRSSAGTADSRPVGCWALAMSWAWAASNSCHTRQTPLR